MSERDKEKQGTPRGARFIAYWLWFAAVHQIYYLILEPPVALASLDTILRLVFIVFAFLSGVGLILVKNWARKMTISFFLGVFLWAIWNVNVLRGPAFKYIIIEQSEFYGLSEAHTFLIIVVLLAGYILWPVMAVFYFTFPRVKDVYDPPKVVEYKRLFTDS
jgi:hypothetical protein